MTTDCVVVTTTVNDKAVADALASAIVEKRLAACVQRSVVKSVYRWQGAVEQAEEQLLACKTRADLADALVAFVKANHSYDVPEIIVTPIVGGHADYLSWIEQETAT